MFQISSIKGHFDGNAVVLDEPALLAVGQRVRVIVEPAHTTAPPEATSSANFAKAGIEVAFTPLVDMTATLMNNDAWDEAVALHIDPLDQVPADFVRRPGSAAGQIKMADDFAATPSEFEEYL